MAPAAVGLFLVGFFDSPLTIWAQTLRMAIIPPELRGRVFALIRLSIQGFGPVGSALAGFLLPVLGMTHDDPDLGRRYRTAGSCRHGGRSVAPRPWAGCQRRRSAAGSGA